MRERLELPPIKLASGREREDDAVTLAAAFRCRRLRQYSNARAAAAMAAAAPTAMPACWQPESAVCDAHFLPLGQQRWGLTGDTKIGGWRIVMPLLPLHTLCGLSSGRCRCLSKKCCRDEVHVCRTTVGKVSFKEEI